MIGGDGLTAAVAQGGRRWRSKAHGLIKVRVFSDDRAAREALFATLAERLDAAPIQHIGKLLVLWRPIPPKAATERDDRKPGPRVVKLVKFSKSGNHRADGEEGQGAGQRACHGRRLDQARQAARGQQRQEEGG